MTNKQALELLDIVETILENINDMSIYTYNNLCSSIKELKQKIREND